jgi:ubiquinone/menaquinone biosynthesis C-methylase UbiE
MSQPATAELRARTRAHYDRYPFRFDQREVMSEKMEKRVMGAAIKELVRPGAVVLDVGCGACRVAHMVRSVGGRAVGVDLSFATIRSAREHNPDPVVNGDSMRLPLRNAVADLVISNGVIMVTPDARASFMELARVTKPGGTLVVSVYDKRSWYYPVYRYGGAAVRALRRVIGDTGLKLTVFPPFHLAILGLMAVVRRRPFWIPIDIGWNLFHDQFTTPVCTFHTTEEMAAWAREAGLVTEEERSEAARQLITFRLRKPARG